MTAREIIKQLKMQPHPEGGYYAETYRSSATVLNSNGEKRNCCTAIYFLLNDQEKSNFHRIKSDELWFFHSGEPLEILSIRGGEIHSIILGTQMEKGEIPQASIPADTWFGSKVKEGMGYSLVSCTVSPGFDFADFELANRQQLLDEFPQLEKSIIELTR
jgi:predicted cupin superfamily sugar epimerase